MIDIVQRRATKLEDGYKTLNYAERLRRLDLPSLAYSRAWGDIIEMYKHFHSYDAVILSKNIQALQSRESESWN